MNAGDKVVKTLEISDRYSCAFTIIDHIESTLKRDCNTSKLPNSRRFLVTLTVEEVKQ